MQQQTADLAGAATSGAAASVGLAGYIAQANEFMIFIATAIAIISGAWTLWDKYKGARNARSTNLQRRTGSADSTPPEDVGGD